MALVRILVDGYSLLHNWPELAPGRPRHSAAAREDLIHILTQYQDVLGTPITIVFDGGGAPKGTPRQPSTRALEVHYSKTGKTADDVIERVAHRMARFGEVLVVTNDNGVRDTVLNFDGLASDCGNFIQSVEAALGGLQQDLKHHNRKELGRFKEPVKR
mgnify:CR=1 FL=1